jgi:ATP-dependent Lon protease
MAMTGEMTLTGRALPDGGNKEKISAARRTQVKSIIIPEKNRPDLKKMTDEVRKIRIILLVHNINMAPDLVLMNEPC